MKLAEIQVDRCGVWQQLTLPLSGEGLSVLYGPNEAGKSTLAQFIRGVLYGFNPPQEDGHDELLPTASLAGSLVIDDGTGRHRVHRAASAGTRGAACLIGEAADRPVSELLGGLLHGIDEKLFDLVYAVDLRELMELGTLSGEEASRHIYGLSLGPTGRRLLDAQAKAKQQRGRLIDPLQQDGRLVQLFERHDELHAELRGLDQQHRQHGEWCRRRDQLEQEITDLRERKAGIDEQLRGHLFLQRAWGPWHRLREGRDELASLPTIPDFPERGVERLDRLERERKQLAAERKRLVVAARTTLGKLRGAEHDGTKNPLLASLPGYVDQRDWLAQVDKQRLEARHAADDAQLDFESRMEALGPGWTAERIDALELTPAGWQRLAGLRQSLASAMGRRGGLRRKARRLAGAYREQREALAECLHDLEGQSVDTALSQARERLKQVHHLGRLQLREAELNQRQYSLQESHDRLSPQLTLPRWVYIVLGVFSFMGIILAGMGLVTGISSSGIAGAIYALLGITCGGLAWGLKAQYEGDARRRMDDVETQLIGTLNELREVRDSIKRLHAAAAPREEAAAGASASSENGKAAIPDSADAVRIAAERVAELVELARHQRSLQAQQRRVRECRQKLEIARREVDTAQEAWAQLLEEFGLPAELPPGQALDAWQRFIEVADALRQWRHIHEQHTTLNGVWEACRQKISAFGERIEDAEVDYDRPVEVLSAWETRLEELTLAREERRKLIDELRSLRRDISRIKSRTGELAVQRNALLMQAGAANRDEFELRARQSARRVYLEEQTAAAQGDLEVICDEHKDLALVEEDLLAYDAAQNGECIDTLELETLDLEQDLHRAFEHLGGIKHEIATIENDRQSTRLRFDLARIRQQLKDATHDWAVVETASQVGDELRRDFERRHQPEALVTASRYLERLTCGRYVRVWTPLGEKKLLVDDEKGRSLSVASLSRGTREQLFLAVRLAIVEGLAREGISLPMILDDVFVNFDERRAEAAADTLRDFAAEGRQVLLFTCHQHLARLFENRGIAPVWLPAHSDVREESRLAG